MSADDCFCVGCNKKIRKYKSPSAHGEKAVEVRVGEILESQEGRRGRPRKSEDNFKYESTWGLMHVDCFLMAISAPSQSFAGSGNQ